MDLNNVKFNLIFSQEDIKQIIGKIFRNKRVKVYIFGSRAKGNYTEFSDLDLAFISDQDISYELSILREILEESNLVFDVDLVDLSKVGNDFKQQILKEGKLWISLENN